MPNATDQRDAILSALPPTVLGVDHGAIPALVERFDGFDYGYRMRCDCGRASSLSAADYFAEANDAHMDCQHCGASIHFGPAVLAIRDEEDPALDNAAIGTFAWYHTSTWGDWPSPGFAAQTEPHVRAAYERFRWSSSYDPTPELTKALHLGTYEAAIENMLRRMHDQADADSQFYLYRVALQVEPDRINNGYRDENDEPAANITVGDLDAAGLDVVRYLNVHEAMGSLSLAVRPDVIAGVQRIPIPVADLTDLLAPDPFTPEADALDAERAAPDDPAQKLAALEPAERRQMRLCLRPDPNHLIRRAEERELHRYRLWHDFEDVLSNYHLSNVSPVVRRNVMNALGSWRGRTKNADPGAFAAQFRRTAVLLEHPREVIALLAAHTWSRPGAGAA